MYVNPSWLILKLEPSSGTLASDFPNTSIDGLLVLKPSASFFETSAVERLSKPEASKVVVKEVPVPVAGSESPKDKIELDEVTPSGWPAEKSPSRTTGVIDLSSPVEESTIL